MHRIQRIIPAGLFLLTISQCFGQLFCPDPVYPSLNIMHLHFGSQSISLGNNTLLNENIWVYAIKYDPTTHTNKCLGKGNYPGGGPLTIAVNGKDEFSFGYEEGDSLKFIFEIENSCLYDSIFMDSVITFRTGTLKEINAIQAYQRNWVNLQPANGWCADRTASVAVNLLGGLAPYSYLWNNNSADSVIVDLPDGDYSITVTDALGCQLSDTVTVFNVDSIQLTLEIEMQTSSSFCIATAQIAGGTPPFDVEWSSGQTGISAANLPNGEFSVTVTDDNGCSKEASGSCIIDAVSEMDNLFDYYLAPNPAIERISLISTKPIPNAYFSFLDLQGNTLIRQFYNTLNEMTIDLTPFSQGIYFIKIETSLGVSIRKVVMQE